MSDSNYYNELEFMAWEMATVHPVECDGKLLGLPFLSILPQEAFANLGSSAARI